MRSLRLLCALLLALSPAAPASHRRRAREAPGQFDYYVLVLSWSPEFCYSKPNSSECGKHTGFIVHGLWPENNDGSYPQNCATNQPAPTDFAMVSGIMPQEIIEHEWQAHGTCSGLSGNAYFALIRKVFQSVSIPGQFRGLLSSFTLRPRDLKKDFEQVNRDLNESEIAVQVYKGYLSAVKLCVSKGQNPVPAACSNIGDAGGGTFRVPPVR